MNPSERNVAFSATPAVVGVVALAILFAPQRAARSQTAPGERLTFDVASIKPSAANSEFHMSFGPGSHMILSHVGLEFLIKYAYGLNDGQLSSGPDWFRTKAFDIDAKCDPPVGGDLRGMSSEQRQAYQKQMLMRLQSLLADRFQLKLRQETREMAGYELILAKNGSKLQESPPPDADGKRKQGAIVRRGHVEAYHVDGDIIARILSQVSGHSVVDRTGLTGGYDFKLDWTPDSGESLGPREASADSTDARPSLDTSGPSLFTAVQEQLGLRLKSAKVAVAFFVVEAASLPTAN